MTTSKEALRNALDAEPHFVIHVGGAGPGWHSEPYPNRAAALAWIEGYGVTQEYKDAHYRVVHAGAYYGRHKERL